MKFYLFYTSLLLWKEYFPYLILYVYDFYFKMLFIFVYLFLTNHILLHSIISCSSFLIFLRSFLENRGIICK